MKSEPIPQSEPPIRGWREALAGCELAAMSIPQVLGYAKIAGMPVVTGFYTLLFPLVTFAVLGSSRSLVVAADSATAAILANGLSPLATMGGTQYVAMAGMVALLTGALLLLARLFRLGFLADFLSRTVLIGFLAGVGVQLTIDVLGEMLGIDIKSTNTVNQFLEVVRNLQHVHVPTMLVTLAIVGGVLALSRWAPRVPGPLIAVIGSIVASMAWNFAGSGIVILGPVVGGMPHLTLPDIDWRKFESLIPLAGSCCVVILAQSAATSRFYALRHHQELDENRDLIGLSAANFAASLSGTFVVNGSPTQTAMAETSGSRSQWAHGVTAFVVAVVLLFLTGPLQFLPRCALGSVVFLLALRLMDWRTLRDMRVESPGEFALALVTVIIVILFGVEKGILLATALSILRIIWHSYHPHTGVLVQEPSGSWVTKPATPGTVSKPGLVIYRFGAALYYANAGLFAAEIKALVGIKPIRVGEPEPSPVRWLVIDAEAISQIDYSAARVVLDLQQELSRHGVELVFARVPPYLRADMDRHHLIQAIGPERLFTHLQDARDAFANKTS